MSKKIETNIGPLTDKIINSLLFYFSSKDFKHKIIHHTKPYIDKGKKKIKLYLIIGFILYLLLIILLIIIIYILLKRKI